MRKLNPSIKHHLVIGLFLAVWFFLFAFFIKPFDDGSISFRYWIFISVGFSVIAFISYGVLAVVQKIYYEKALKWNAYLEVASLVFFQLLFLLNTYIYYKTILNGGYSFFKFTQIIVLNLALITTPVLILVRVYAVKLIPIEDENVTILGDNKLDILKIKKCDLVCVSNAQNYVEIFFLENNELKTKLIRSTLKKMENDFRFLAQIHRSHLINPFHFKFWKDQDTIALTQIELPVSKKYKPGLLALQSRT